jgi:2-polyprenyl-3-methyl-5-hydroxy-6-metoxy-1,4-benzoquinol methylase
MADAEKAEAASGTSLGSEYDRQYRTWLSRLGAQALDLEWRIRHLLWRHRVLLRRYSLKGKRVLDFGCMDGVFTLMLQRLGAEAVGFDISAEAVAQAEKFRGPRPHPTFTTVRPGPGQFDLVFCNEVLEHIPDDSAFVGELVKLVAPGGMLIGTTPVGRYFWDADHKREYNEESLARALVPWGSVRIRRYYRSPLRNFLPLKQTGAAVFIFEVRPLNLRDSH